MSSRGSPVTPRPEPLNLKEIRKEQRRVAALMQHKQLKMYAPKFRRHPLQRGIKLFLSGNPSELSSYKRPEGLRNSNLRRSMHVILPGIDPPQPRPHSAEGLRQQFRRHSLDDIEGSKTDRPRSNLRKDDLQQHDRNSDGAIFTKDIENFDYGNLKRSLELVLPPILKDDSFDYDRIDESQVNYGMYVPDNTPVSTADKRNHTRETAGFVRTFEDISEENVKRHHKFRKTKRKRVLRYRHADNKLEGQHDFQSSHEYICTCVAPVWEDVIVDTTIDENRSQADSGIGTQASNTYRSEDTSCERSTDENTLKKCAICGKLSDAPLSEHFDILEVHHPPSHKDHPKGQGKMTKEITLSLIKERSLTLEQAIASGEIMLDGGHITCSKCESPWTDHEEQQGHHEPQVKGQTKHKKRKHHPSHTKGKKAHFGSHSKDRVLHNRDATKNRKRVDGSHSERRWSLESDTRETGDAETRDNEGSLHSLDSRTESYYSYYSYAREETAISSEYRRVSITDSLSDIDQSLVDEAWQEKISGRGPHDSRSYSDLSVGHHGNHNAPVLIRSYGTRPTLSKDTMGSMDSRTSNQSKASFSDDKTVQNKKASQNVKNGPHSKVGAIKHVKKGRTQKKTRFSKEVISGEDGNLTVPHQEGEAYHDNGEHPLSRSPSYLAVTVREDSPSLSYMRQLQEVDDSINSGIFNADINVDSRDLNTKVSVSPMLPERSLVQLKPVRDMNPRSKYSLMASTYDEISRIPSEAYARAVAYAQKDKLPSDSSLYYDRITRPYVFSYFQPINRLCPCCNKPTASLGAGHKNQLNDKTKGQDAKNKDKSNKKTKGSKKQKKLTPMKSILGNVDMFDFYPGGKFEPAH